MASKVVNQDIALSGGDLLMIAGDLAIASSDTQHITDNINSFPGWWKEVPALGVGLLQYLNSAGQEQTLKKQIRINLTADGYQVGNPTVTTDASGVTTVNPDATR